MRRNSVSSCSFRSSVRESRSLSSNSGDHEPNLSEENLMEGGEHSWRWSWSRFWRYTGPGWLMSISYVDPGNLIANVQSGSVAGYSLGWVLLLATVLGLILQVVVARIANVSGFSLAQLCRMHYPRWVSLTVWLMIELAIIGSDIQEVVGSAIALRLLFGIPLYLGVIITAFDTFIVLLIHFYGIRKLEAVFGLFIFTMSVCFIAEFIISAPPPLKVIEGIVIPRIPPKATEQAVAVFGAVVMPANLFLHSSLVLTRKVNRKSKSEVEETNSYFRAESIIALMVSFVINESIMAVFANGFHVTSGFQQNVGLQQAGDLLKIKYGRLAEVAWGIGLLAAGQSSTMAGTLTGQFVMEGFLRLEVTPWLRTFVTRLIAIVPSMIVALLFRSGLDSLDEWLNVFQSLQLPFALLPLLLFCGQTKILGSFRLGMKSQAFIFVLFCLVMAGNGYLLWSFLSNFQVSILLVVATGIVGAFYLSFVFYLASAVLLSHFSTYRGLYGCDLDESSAHFPLLTSDIEAYTSESPLSLKSAND